MSESGERCISAAAVQTLAVFGVALPTSSVPPTRGTPVTAATTIPGATVSRSPPVEETSVPGGQITMEAGVSICRFHVSMAEALLTEENTWVTCRVDQANLGAEVASRDTVDKPGTNNCDVHASSSASRVKNHRDFETACG